jgi:ABC-type glycerol-3-phosphate transport system permease component
VSQLWFVAALRQRAASRHLQDGLQSAVVNLMLVGASALAMLPFLYMLSTSLQSMSQILQGKGLIPNPPTLEAYTYVLTRMPFFLYLKNTLVITSWAVLGAVISNTLAAYGFARFRFPGRDFMFTLLLSSMMLPGVVRLIPTYIMFSSFGWVNTFLPLIVPAFFAGPFFVFMLRQFFRGLPEDLFDAAIIDGANELVTLTRIVVPLARPALATMTVFSFAGSWSDFFGPLIYLKDARLRTLALGLYVFRSEPQGIPSVNNLMAIATFMVLPILILFIAFQRYFIEGITISGLKG